MLGPLIFLILIGDIDEEIAHSVLKSFADDTRATKSVKSTEDTILLQKDQDETYKWTDKNNMMLNDVKFELLRYGKNEGLKNQTSYTTPSGDLITTKQEVKDLGVIMSNDCLFVKQINTVIEKAKNLISWILRSFRTRNFDAMITLYKSLVIPILEYCSVLWCPSSIGLIQNLEAIQWSFLRKTNGSAGNDYWTCLKNMKVYSLQRRRERYRIIYIWKVLENLVPNINDQIKCKENARRGRHCIIPRLRGNGKTRSIHEASLSVHGSKLFNALPKQIRDTTNVSIAKFKRALDAYLAHIPDEPQIPGYTACKRASSNSIIHMHKNAPSDAVPASLQELHNSQGEANDRLA